MAQLRCTHETSQSGNFYRLVVTVEAAFEIDPNVFLYLALPLRDGQTDREAQFQGVCSPKDMVDWPVGEPAPNAEPPWLRHNSIDLLFPCLAETTAAWTLIQEELDALCSTMETLEVLTSSEMIVFGQSEPGGFHR